MKRIIKNLALALMASATLSVVPVYADASTALSLEKAQMKYVLSYQALQKAKITPNQQGNLAKFVKNYREAYAQYLQLLRDNNLYDPAEKDLNPANDYNDQQFALTKKWQNWESINPNEYEDLVNSYVEQGKTPDEVINTVMDKIPDETYSEEFDNDSDNLDKAGNIPEELKCPGRGRRKPRDGRHHHRRHDKPKTKTNVGGVLEEVYKCGFCGQDYPAKMK
jgi:hypothetical protein